MFEKTTCLSEQDMQGYLAEALDEDRRHKVEKHLLDCQLCSAALEGYASRHRFDKTALKEDVKMLKTNLRQQSSKADARVIPAKIWRRVAAVTLLVISLLAFSLYWQSRKNDRLFARYFEVAESSYQVTRTTTPIPGIPLELQKAMEYYEAENYLVSLPHFENYLEENSADFEALFYAGIANMETGNMLQAKAFLKQVRLNKKEKAEAASWHLALCLVKEKKNKEAALLLEGLSNSEDRYYGEKARELLQKINYNSFTK